MAVRLTKPPPEARLNEAGIDIPHIMITGDHVRDFPKPFGNGYLLACEQLGVDPIHSYAFEDTKAGLQAARSAGMNAIVVIKYLGYIMTLRLQSFFI